METALLKTLLQKLSNEELAAELEMAATKGSKSHQLLLLEAARRVKVIK